MRRGAGDGALFQQKTGKRLWVASVEVPTFDGKRRQVRKYAKTKSEAARKLRALRAEAHVEKLGRPTTTVGQWLAVWLETIKRPQVAPNTYRFYEEAIRCHVTPAIGGIRLDALVAQHVRHMLATIATTRNKQRAHLVMSMALDSAVAEGLIDRNPVKLVDKPKHLASPSVALDVSASRALLDSALELDARPGAPQLASRWVAGLLTGARRGELLGLQWDRVDLDGGRLVIDWQLQELPRVHGCDPPCGRSAPRFCPQARVDVGAHVEYRPCYGALAFTRPKTSAGRRVVPLTWPLLPMLSAHAELDTPNPHGLVWRMPDGRPISPRKDHQLWRELLAHAGLSHVKLHTLRHTAATLLARSSVPDDVRMHIMGHSSYLAHQGYVHVDLSDQRKALNSLAKRLYESGNPE